MVLGLEHMIIISNKQKQVVLRRIHGYIILKILKLWFVLVLRSAMTRLKSFKYFGYNSSLQVIYTFYIGATNA